MLDYEKNPSAITEKEPDNNKGLRRKVKRDRERVGPNTLENMLNGENYLIYSAFQKIPISLEHVRDLPITPRWLNLLVR